MGSNYIAPGQIDLRLGDLPASLSQVLEWMGSTTTPDSTSFFDTGSLTERREVDSAGLASQWGLEMLRLSHSVGITGFFWGGGWALGLQSSCYAYVASTSLTELYPHILCIWVFACMFVYRCVCLVSKEVRIGFQTPWIWMWFVNQHVCETKLRVPARTASILNHRSHCPAPPSPHPVPKLLLIFSFIFVWIECFVCLNVCVLCASLVPGFRSLK